MAGKNDNFDALMAMMALKHIMDDTKDIEIHPFTCEVTVTPTSISCSSSGNKAFLEDIDGGMEWAEETNNLIKDIMSEQTIKLTDLMKKKFGFDGRCRFAGGLIMDFGKALEAVKSGKKIFRLGWNGKGMFVVYQKGYPDGIPCNLQTAKAWGMNEGDLFKCDPYLQIKTADGSHAMWVPSIGDILAEDWQIIQ